MKEAKVFPIMQEHVLVFLLVASHRESTAMREETSQLRRMLAGGTNRGTTPSYSSRGSPGTTPVRRGDGALSYTSNDITKKLIKIHIIFHILRAETFLKCDWLRQAVFQSNLKYLHVKITVSMARD